jgi:hypothetical protein
MWIDNDECAFGTRRMGGTCQNLIAKGVSDRGFQCKWNADYVTIFSIKFAHVSQWMAEKGCFSAEAATNTSHNAQPLRRNNLFLPSIDSREQT